MSWTYSGDPSNSDLDEVRFLIGDTNPDEAQLQDEEIQYLVNLYGSGPAGNLVPAIYAIESLIARYARSVDKSVGDLRISHSNRVKQFQDLATRLRQRATLKGVRTFFTSTADGEVVSGRRSVFDSTSGLFDSASGSFDDEL
jgi:pyruvate formate-lyase activating enzyme-like uncharacterized protein